MNTDKLESWRFKGTKMVGMAILIPPLSFAFLSPLLFHRINGRRTCSGIFVIIMVKAFVRIALIVVTTVLGCSRRKNEKQICQLEEEEDLVWRRNERLGGRLNLALRENEEAERERKAICKAFEDLKQKSKESITLSALSEKNARMESKLETISKERAALMQQCEDLANTMCEIDSKREELRKKVYFKDAEIFHLTQQVRAKANELERLRAAAAQKSSS